MDIVSAYNFFIFLIELIKLKLNRLFVKFIGRNFYFLLPELEDLELLDLDEDPEERLDDPDDRTEDPEERLDDPDDRYEDPEERLDDPEDL